MGPPKGWEHEDGGGHGLQHSESGAGLEGDRHTAVALHGHLRVTPSPALGSATEKR